MEKYLKIQRGKYLNIQGEVGVKISQYLRGEMSHPSLMGVGSGKTTEESRGEAGVCRRVWLQYI